MAYIYHTSTEYSRITEDSHPDQTIDHEQKQTAKTNHRSTLPNTAKPEHRTIVESIATISQQH